MACAAVVIAGIAACSGSPEAADKAATATSGAPPAAAGENQAEAPSVAFTHPSLGWSIAAPGAMTAQGTGAAYTGRSDYLKVTVVDGSTDAATAAANESAGTSVPGFALVHQPRTAQISGSQASYLEYTRTDVVNAVTGKPQRAHVLVAFVPRTAGLYRLEYGATVPDANWDPQGALDIVTTFRGGK